jgi:hypothetical protein
LYYFHKKLKIKKTQTHFYWVFLGGFLGFLVGFLGGFLLPTLVQGGGCGGGAGCESVSDGDDLYGGGGQSARYAG